MNGPKGHPTLRGDAEAGVSGGRRTLGANGKPGTSQ